MTDEPETPLTPAEEDEVRRLLGDARHDQPIPPEVAARMDDVLADLAAEPVRRAPVTELATRRRRVTSLLVAAAAVVVVGIGIGQVIGAGTGSDSDAGSATSAESADDANEGAGGADAEPEENRAYSQGSDNAASPGAAELVEGKVFTLRPGELSRDIGKVQSYALDSDATTDEPWSSTRVAKCVTADLGAGTFVPVRYAGRDGVVAFRVPAGDTQVADVYLCGGSQPVRSLTLPIP